MSDRDSGDEQSQVAQRGVHRFAFYLPILTTFHLLLSAAYDFVVVV